MGRRDGGDSLSTAIPVPGCRGALPDTETTVATANALPSAHHRASCSASSSMAPQYFFAPAWIASRMRWYVPHRQTLRISSRSAPVISRPSSRAWRTLATAVMIWPG